MEVLQSRVLLRPADMARSVRFYDQQVGLSRYREWGDPPRQGGVVYFLGGGFLELSAGGSGQPGVRGVRVWLQVADVRDEVAGLRERGVEIEVAPELKPWGLLEASVRDPDGLELVIVETPLSHPLRRRQG